MSCVSSVLIHEDHPALAGHFPGNPIVPGVLVLAEVVAAARSIYGDLQLQAIEHVKFLAPLRPGEKASLAFDLADQRLDFTLERDGVVIARGILSMSQAVA
jgi:3-hydroxyacyl-[acyl-carrier-protein] dehydratase